MSEWSTDDQDLSSNDAPHEPRAVMRLHLAGHRKQTILEEFRIKGTQLMKQLEKSKVEIDEATAKGRPIHDALIPKEKS